MLQEITNTYPPVDVPKAPNLACFSDFKALAGSRGIQGSTYVSKPSGVDVSRENHRVQVKKARTFEERLAQLDISTTMIETKDGIDTLKDFKEQHASAMIKVEDLLERAIKNIHILQLKVEELEVEAIDLQDELDSAHHKIKTHEILIKRFVGPEHVDFQEEYEKDSEDEDANDHDANNHDAQPQPDYSF